MQVGIDLMELEKLYSADIINLYPEDVKIAAGVRNISQKGTTSRNRELKLETDGEPYQHNMELESDSDED